MPETVDISAGAWALAILIVLAALAVFGQVARRLAREGGQVRSEAFDLPELLMSMIFAGYFSLIALSTLVVSSHPESKLKEPGVDLVIPNSLLFIAFVVGIAGLMVYRGLRLRELFGLDRLSFLRTIGWAVGLTLAAVPLAEAANLLAGLFIPKNPEPQVLVDLFVKVARQHDYASMSKILVSAVVIMPACEEFLFRGFFYGVWKKYVGPWASGFLACFLFAAFHTNLAAFAGLFVLAVCLTIAYERTGSLFVNILIHALFNFVNLVILYVQANAHKP